MSVALYMDVHVRRAITEALRLRGVEVLTAQEDGANRLSDPDLLDRARLRDGCCSVRMRICWRKPRGGSELAHLLPELFMRINCA